MSLRCVVFCISAFLIQTISSQCVGYGSISPCNGNFPSSVNLPQPGMTICSDNLIIEGPVCIQGRVPFSATVAVEGQFPTSGYGKVTYECGNDFGLTNLPLGYGGRGGNCGCGRQFY
ncbi:chorion class B protein M2410-like [Bombyx mori]|uniref:Chorion class B n=1 Tax=Bombyx mori TaxID=7091 RepID=A0A0K2S2W8_BOMMO|nr:chorion class B protein M2410-like [Bombyx mori]BAS21459.1 chorion class B [Bombyx mori]